MDARPRPEEYGNKPIFDFQEYLLPIREEFLKKTYKNETRLPASVKGGMSQYKDRKDLCFGTFIN